jgi:hypothetical protein
LNEQEVRTLRGAIAALERRPSPHMERRAARLAASRARTAGEPDAPDGDIDG